MSLKAIQESNEISLDKSLQEENSKRYKVSAVCDEKVAEGTLSRLTEPSVDRDLHARICLSVAVST